MVNENSSLPGKSNDTNDGQQKKQSSIVLYYTEMTQRSLGKQTTKN
jgi:hypothetical protein